MVFYFLFKPRCKIEEVNYPDDNLFPSLLVGAGLGPCFEIMADIPGVIQRELMKRLKRTQPAVRIF
jgi:hypothetical protein